MYKEQFIAEVLEQLFNRGFVGPHALDASEFLEREYDDDELPNHDEFVDLCIRHFKLTCCSRNHELGITSTTAGAAHYWLAIHEAGHAIVGVKMGFLLTGVWFFCNGEKGEAIFHDPDFPDAPQEAEALLRKLIAIDVAGIVAENLLKAIHIGSDTPEALLSTWYSDRLVPGCACPSDFPIADAKAHRIVNLQFNGSAIEWNDRSVWPQKTEILLQAEAEAEQILSQNIRALNALADVLLKGPITGSSVRQLLNQNG